MERGVFKQQFDQMLHTHLTSELERVTPYIFGDTLGPIYEFLLPYSTGGKRIRPYLVYLTYKLTGGKDDQIALQTGLVNEMIHLFALIHDDITDKGTMRHQLPTYHEYIAKTLDNNTTQGTNIALLIGDLLLARANSHLHQLTIEPTTKQLFHDMIHETICGQIMDVHLSASKTFYPAEIITTKDHAKSGYYTFLKPMMIGASLTGNEADKQLYQLGELLGLTYQMRDDLLDIIDGHGDKTPFSDHQEGNQTFLLAYAYEHATPDQQAFLHTTRGKPGNTDTHQQLLDIYTQTGTIARAHQKIKEQLDLAHTITTDITKTSYDTSYTEYLHALIDFLHIPNE